MVGLGVDFADVAAYVHHNDVGHRVAARRPPRTRASRAGSCSPAAWWSTARARYRCAEHGDGAPGASTSGSPRRRAGTSCRARAAAATSTGSSSTRTRPLDPRNVYAATKVHQEHLLHAFEREHPGTSAIALRYHNVYGPGMPQDTPYAGVASIFRSAIERGERPRVFEDGGQRRDFVHVHDVARANLLALCAPRWTSAARSTWRAASPARSGRWRPRSRSHHRAAPPRWSAATGSATSATWWPPRREPTRSCTSRPRSPSRTG